MKTSVSSLHEFCYRWSANHDDLYSHHYQEVTAAKVPHGELALGPSSWTAPTGSAVWNDLCVAGVPRMSEVPQADLIWRSAGFRLVG